MGARIPDRTQQHVRTFPALIPAALDTDFKVSQVTAVKERRIHDFKGLTRGGRPLSRWKFPVAGTGP
jgi:hypothetical protein